MRRWGLVVLVLVACGGGGSQKSPIPPLDAAMDTSPAPVAAKPRKSKGKTVPEPKPAPKLDEEKNATKSDENELPVEELEANPDSATVALRLVISPPAKGVVLWGQKTLARFSPTSMDVEISRPRGSGPLDLEIRAEGFLIHHTRLFADRSDKTSVRLYRAEDAVGLHGYKPPQATK